jgi:hypothetical protein
MSVICDSLAASLPTELHYHLLSFMDVGDLCLKVGRISPYWNQLADDELLWKQKVYDYSTWGPKLKTENITWKALYKKISSFGFDPEACGKFIALSENNLVATKSDDTKYSTVLGQKMSEEENGGKHYWEIQVVDIKTSGCLCVGVVNTRDAINFPSESHGMFGHYGHGWGLFSDGERCHAGSWIRPAYSSFTTGDRVGVLVEYQPEPEHPVEQGDESEFADNEDDEVKLIQKMANAAKKYTASVSFYINGVCQGVSFSGIEGALYPAFALKRKGEAIRLIPEASFSFISQTQI